MNLATLAIGAVVVLVLAIAASQWLRRRNEQSAYAAGHDYTVLLMRVPKEGTKPEEKQKTIPEQIAPAEALFAILAGRKEDSPHCAFEIVAKDGRISFYMAVPRAAQQFYEEQVHAQYPDVHFDEVEDYNPFTPTGAAVGTTLSLERKAAFPIKTYRNQDTDPLNALTNALSRFGENEAGVIQFVIHPAKRSWNKEGSKLAQGLREGKSLEELTKSERGKHFRSALSVVGSSMHTESKKEDAGAPGAVDQALIEALEQKTSKAGLGVTVRLVVSSVGAENAEVKLQSLTDAFAQYRNYEHGNGFKASSFTSDPRFMRAFIYRTVEQEREAILNSEEVASLYHLPLPSTETPRINWLTARTLPAPNNLPTEGVYLGENVYRGERHAVYMKRDDRRRHMYIVGTTGTGKSNLLGVMAVQDIENGEGVAVVDPHGSTVEAILENIPAHRKDDVVYFDPADTEWPVGLNMLEAANAQEADFAVQEMIAIFYKLVTDPSMIGPMFEHNMRNAMLTLIANREHPGTIADIPRMFTDTAFQKYAIGFVTDPIVRNFWEKEMAKTSDYHKSEMLGYLISKVGRFVENAMMRNIIGQATSGFSFRQVMDDGKILLVNLSKGRVGEMNANLLGLIVVAKLQMAALARADMPESERRDFFLYIDEFQNFITDSIATILSEARKYKLNLILAHQYIAQLTQNNDTRVRDAVFGNVGTIAAYRVGVDDTEMLAQQFAPVVSEYDLVNQERFKAYLRLLIDGTASKAMTLAPPRIQKGDSRVTNEVRQLSRMKYGRPRAEVEEEILVRTKLGASEAAPQPAPVPAPR